jgi:capsid portal protein
MDMYQSIEELSQGLRLPPGAATIADLVAASHKDRQDILSLNDLIANFRTILIVPDSEKETISRGHRLVPRYMGFIGANLSDFAAVLHKTLELVQKQGN